MCSNCIPCIAKSCDGFFVHVFQAFADDLIETEELSAEQKDEFKVSVGAVTLQSGL